MRVFFLTIALVAFAWPVFADCSPDHQAAKSDTVVKTGAPPPPAPQPSSGG